MSTESWEQLGLEAGRVFTPNTPINEKTLFAGRVDQIRRIVDAVNQTGQHAMLFGERGVGKTSLANVVGQFQTRSGSGIPVVAPRVNCDSSDDFTSVWRKIFDQVEFIRTNTTAGFLPVATQSLYNASEFVGDAQITPEGVKRVVAQIARSATTILIIDEFDRLRPEYRKMFGDLIKSLSDHSIPVTVMIVGVAEAIDDLIEGHQSVSRAVVQIQMPRMKGEEIEEIMRAGVKRLGMTIDDDAKARVILLAQGLPHYAHLVALHAARAAIDAQSLRISMDSVNQAIRKSINDAQHTIQTAYHNAIRSQQKGNLFADVLFSCALAQTNEIGEFGAPDVRAAMKAVTGKEYEIPSFAQHLKEFSASKRGNILRKIGQTRRFRYRFSDPLMQPYVIMQGLAAGRISEGALTQEALPT